jgi:hypothetical protein
LHFDKALEDMQFVGRVSSGESLRIASAAVKSVLNFDAGNHEEALCLVQEVLEYSRSFTPENDLSFHIPASVCMAFKIATYMGRTELAPELRIQLNKWRGSFHGVAHWEQMVDNMYLASSLEQPMHVTPPVFNRHLSGNSSSNTSPTSPPESGPYTVPTVVFSRLPPLHTNRTAKVDPCQVPGLPFEPAVQHCVEMQESSSSDDQEQQNPQLQAFLSSSGLFPFGAPPISNWPSGDDMLHDHSSGSGEILFDDTVESYFDHMND